MKRKVKRLAKMLFSLLLCCALTLTSIQMPAYAKSGEWTGGQVDSGYRLKIVYSESAQNPKTNTSKVTATLYLVQDKGYDLYIGARSATITINGNQTTISNIPAIRNTGNVTTKLGSATTTVKHTSDGSKSITISASFDMNAKLSGTYYGTMSTSKKVSLDKLDRTAPTVSLKLNSVTSSSVKMTATADVSCDNWQYSLDGGSTWKTFASSGKSNAFTISNLSGGKKYTVVARARKVNNNVFSEQSKSVSATTKPNPPGNLSVSAVKKDSAKLSWNSTTGATSYNVYLNDKVIEKNVQGTSYTFSNLTPNSAYTFGVSATGTSGDSSLAKTAEYVTLASAPTKVKVQSQNQDSVKLSWSQSTDGNEATITYNIYRDDKLIGTSSTNSYTDTVYNNTDCKYAVCAVTSAGNSAKSSAVSVKHVPLSINAEVTNKSYYTIITPTYKGGVNREIDPTSCKWAYGNKEISDFENGGYAFSTSFAVTKNGTYTVYAQDVDGNEAVGTFTVSDIYTIDTIGAFTENDTDLYVESIGLPVSFERTYNSMSEDDIFGKGWSFNYAKKTVLNEAGTVRLVYLPDGSINYFAVNDDGTFSGIKTQNTLTVANDIYEVTTKDNYKYIYENETLTTIQDANGNKIIIDLNAKQLPEKITDSADRTYTIEYDESGHITTITDPANRCVSYAYEDGMLTSVTALTQEVSETYEYTDGLLTVVKDASGKVTSQLIYNDQKQVDKLTNEDGDETYYYYHITRNGEVVVYEDDAEIIIDEMDSDSNPASNIYNTFGQLIVSADGYLYEYNQDGTISKVDGTNSDKTLVIYSYDDYGNVTKIITKSADEQTLEEEKYTYTYHDGTSAIASEEITTTSYNYDESGECESTETKTSSYSFDKCGNVLSEQEDTQSEDAISYSYDEKGLILTKSDSSTTVEYTYDANGYISTEEVSEDGKETTKETSYNVIGNLLSTTEGGLTTEYLYDLAGNEIRIKQNDGDTVLVSRYIYNRNHKVIQAIGADNYSESDDLLNPDENGLCQENIYEDSNVGERYTYDEDGNVLTYINAANNQTVNTYDADGNLVKTVTYESCDTTKDGLTTRYVYDSEGRLTQTIYPHQYQASKDQLDVENGINEYDDDSVGERASYDEDGNVIAQTNSFGEETTNLYDANGKLVKSTTGKKVTRFVYDGGENLLQVIYPNQYDEEDDKLDLGADEPINQYANADVGDRYEYDSDGNIIKYTNSYGIVSENTYEDGKLIKVSRSDGTEFSYNKSGEATKETYANGLTNEISHTEDQTIITGSNGLTTTYQKNGFGEITSYHLETDSIDQDYTYTYDAKGNILSVSLNDDLLQSYCYNASDELIRVNDQVADETVTYQYDYVGNITEVATYAYTEGSLGDAITTEVYSYDTNNRRSDLCYDDDGNLTQFNGYELSWTDRRLKSATSTDHDISYTYNYAGIRTSKTVDGTQTTYKVDDNNNVIELSNDSQTITFAYNSSGSPIYLEYDGKTYYYEKNLQGDVVGILNTEGEEVVHYDYNAWGEVTGVTGTLADTLGKDNPLCYRGYFYDEETGLYYLQSRYYSADLMRFLSEDAPVLSNDQGEPLGSNLYGYCVNNPVNYSDYTGHYAASIALQASIITKLAAAMAGIMGGIRFSMDSIKVAIACSWLPLVCIAATSVAAAGLVYTVKTFKKMNANAAKVRAAVKACIARGGIDPDKTHGNTVYVITRRRSDDVVYVGRTNDYKRRRNEHQNSKKGKFPEKEYDMYAFATGLSKRKARVLEQTLITAYSLETLANMINSISPKKWKNFKSEFEQMKSLIEAVFDPE